MGRREVVEAIKRTPFSPAYVPEQLVHSTDPQGLLEAVMDLIKKGLLKLNELKELYAVHHLVVVEGAKRYSKREENGIRISSGDYRQDKTMEAVENHVDTKPAHELENSARTTGGHSREEK